ncbi:hypothetical protein [Rhizobium leguminosarum]|uniref:hypothetical protein n=1 Tax=Rhizobium leguminosarum TaxID=384 RepID=UPI003F95DE35
MSANGQFFEQSMGGCFSSGQQGISSVAEAVSADTICMSVPGISAGPDEAIALSATPTLTGPRMTPSIARTQSRR